MRHVRSSHFTEKENTNLDKCLSQSHMASWLSSELWLTPELSETSVMNHGASAEQIYWVCVKLRNEKHSDPFSSQSKKLAVKKFKSIFYLKMSERSQSHRIFSYSLDLQLWKPSRQGAVSHLGGGSHGWSASPRQEEGKVWHKSVGPCPPSGHGSKERKENLSFCI